MGRDVMGGEELRVGIVGAGIMGRVHAASLNRYHRSRVVAWAGTSVDEAELAASFGPARVYREVEEMVADGGVDAVLVATPDFAHAGPALAALRAGKHVLVEKPLATTAAEASAVRDAARSAGRIAMTLYNHRWVPAYWQAWERCGQGRLGEPVMAYARKNDTREVPTRMIRWADRTTPSWFLSSHDIDLVSWYFGARVVEVYASSVGKVLRAQGVDTPDAIVAQARFEGGALATFEACWAYVDTFPTMTDSFVGLVFSDGVIHLDRKSEQIEVAGPERFEYPRNLLINRVGGRPSGSTYAAVCHFVDCVLDGDEPLVTLDSSVHVTEVLEAIHTSCERGVPVHLGPVH